ncbi:MAG: hypothetical protein LC745_11175 [Planctomycetia bacterium]|nr:hypothetical protein [Planctomycetia bacterium]
MPTIVYVHWNQDELSDRVGPIVDAGYRVRAHASLAQAPRFPEPDPTAVVISLDRLPSHGREVAGLVWGSRKRQNVPIIFEGGDPDKVAATRERLPRAAYCPTGGVVDVLKGLGVSP